MLDQSVHTGGCQCGNIRYRLEGKIFRLNICHCKDCQRQSGSAFGMSLIVSPETFKLTSGELKTFQLNADSGRTKTCAFCPDCGVRIYNQTSALSSVKAGTLDDASWLAPDAHYWISRKQPWTTLPDDVPCFETHDD
jgi:hypothetical protein